MAQYCNMFQVILDNGSLIRIRCKDQGLQAEEGKLVTEIIFNIDNAEQFHKILGNTIEQAKAKNEKKH